MLDRVARSVGHFAAVADELLGLGVDLVFLDQPAASVRRGDPMSKAFRGIAAVFAELERDLAVIGAPRRPLAWPQEREPCRAAPGVRGEPQASQAGRRAPGA